MSLRIIAILPLFIFALGCSNGSSPNISVIPYDLSIEVEVSNNGSGFIGVTAKAKNAFAYELYPNEFINADPEVSTSGVFQYQYTNSGDYQIEIRAIGNGGDYISEVENISITVDGSIVIPTTGYSTPDSYDGMDLIWQDEFAGTGLNEGEWTYEIGTGNNGWGNNELQYYRKENTSVVDGFLIIEAKKEQFQGKSYTSSRLITEGNFEFKYGRVDIRALLPKGQGIWPALWMLGANFRNVGWPYCGEIDIMEMVGGAGRENTVHGTLHWDNEGAYACTCDQGNSYSLSSGIFNDEFHVFTLLWDESSIQWLVDDVTFKTVDITPEALSEFRNNFFLIFNVAVGGNWPGSPDNTTQFPQRMIVDYVRVFQNQ